MKTQEPRAWGTIGACKKRVLLTAARGDLPKVQALLKTVLKEY